MKGEKIMPRWKILSPIFVCALLAALFVAVFSPFSVVPARAQDYSETEPPSQHMTMTVVSKIMLPLIINGNTFYTDTADSISGSGFKNRTITFEGVKSSCVSYDMHFTANNNTVVVVTREDIDTVETKDSGTDVVVKYFWWRWYKSWGSEEYVRYMLFCRNTSTTNPMWPQ